MLPSHVDGGFPIVGYDDELRWPVAVMTAKGDYVGRENSEKPEEGKRVRTPAEKNR